MADDWTFWQNIAHDQENERNNHLREVEAEQERQLGLRKTRLESAQGHINRSYDSQFAPEFYAQYGRDLMNYWTPDIERQYGDAQRQLNYTFAEAQPGGGSAPAEGFGRLKEAHDKALLAAGDNATAQEKALQQQVEGTRSSLLSSVNADTDPGAAQATVARTISSIPVKPAYSPIGDIFSNITGQFATAMQAARNGGPGWGFGHGSSGGSGGSSERIVN